MCHFVVHSSRSRIFQSLLDLLPRDALAQAKGNVYKGKKPALNAERIAQLREQAVRELTKQNWRKSSE